MHLLIRRCNQEANPRACNESPFPILLLLLLLDASDKGEKCSVNQCFLFPNSVTFNQGCFLIGSVCSKVSAMHMEVCACTIGHQFNLQLCFIPLTGIDAKTTACPPGHPLQLLIYS
jgi:hypothetical protein